MDSKDRLTPAGITGLTCFHRQSIGPNEIDAMGHMNVRHYLAMFDNASWPYFASFGMDDEYYATGIGGGFALTHFIRYLAEVREGEQIAVYARTLARSEKRIHHLYFMINESRDNVAATMEAVSAHADRRIRRTSPFPDGIAAKIDLRIAADSKLLWTPPLSGSMRV